MFKKISFVLLSFFIAAAPLFAQQQGIYNRIIGGDAEKKAEVPEYTYLYDTSLIRAIKANDEDRIKILLYANVDTNEKNDEGFTPLVLAAEKTAPEYIRMMLQRGANVNLRSKYNVTPLMSAAAAGRPEVVSLLLEYGADPALTDDLGMNALLHAVKNKSARSVGILSAVTKKSDFDIRDNNNMTPILYAVRNGDIESAVYLGKAGANLDLKDDLGKTPLIIAINNGNTALARELINLGANLEEKDFAARTPLMHAVQGGYLVIVNDLIAAGADIETTDLVATTPLILAAREGHSKIAAALVKAGADTNAKDKLGRTPLTWAVENDDYATFTVLLSADALNPNFIYGDDGATPLITAVKKKDYKMTAALVKHGANVNIKDKYDRNPLIYAVEGGDFAVLNAVLASASAEPNLIYGAEKTTPLITAVRNRDYKAVVALVEKGANVNKEDIFGNTPLVYALQNDDNKTVKYLIKKGATQEPQTKYKVIPQTPEEEEEDYLKSVSDIDGYIEGLQSQIEEAKRAKQQREAAAKEAAQKQAAAKKQTKPQASKQ